MKKLSIGLNIVLIVIFALFYQYQKEEIILNTALFDAKSSNYLYALEHNKTESLEFLLISDLIFLIDNYDYKIYKLSRNINRVLCNDIPKYHNEKIKQYLINSFYETEQGKQFKIHILDNINLISNKFCLDFNNEDKPL